MKIVFMLICIFNLIDLVSVKAQGLVKAFLAEPL